MSSLWIAEDYEHMSELALEVVLGEIKGHFTLGCITGSTPLRFYELLCEQEINAALKTANGDEYIVPGDSYQKRAMNPESYTCYMRQNLWDKIELEQTVMPPALVLDPERLESELANSNARYVGTGSGKAIELDNCVNPYLVHARELIDEFYQILLSWGGIDLMLQGIGEDGHSFFHEKGIPLDKKAFLVKLADSTLENAVEDGHFQDPESSFKYAVTLGTGGVYELSRKIVVLASGQRKTKAVTQALLGPVTPELPISFTQNCRDVLYIVDRVAGKNLLGKENELQKKHIDLKFL